MSHGQRFYYCRHGRDVKTTKLIRTWVFMHESTYYCHTGNYCSPLVVPVLRGKVGHEYSHIFFVLCLSPLLIYLSLRSLSIVSNSNCLNRLLLFSIILLLFPNISYRNTPNALLVFLASFSHNFPPFLGMVND